MSALFAPERKPWEGSPPGQLSPSDYAATAVFGIAELAVETLHEHDREIRPEAVAQYAKIFARVLIGVQVEVGSGGTWSSSLNTRLRGALRTAIRVERFDEPDQDAPAASYADWEGRLRTTTLNIAKTAAWLHRLGPEDLRA